MKDLEALKKAWQILDQAHGQTGARAPGRGLILLKRTRMETEAQDENVVILNKQIAASAPKKKVLVNWS